MFKLFKKKTERERLEDKYEQLLQESYELSRIDRTKADLKAQEAQQLLQKIDALEQ